MDARLGLCWTASVEFAAAAIAWSLELAGHAVH
jgi:hypothetical protein